jgi:hypothetical protein
MPTNINTSSNFDSVQRIEVTDRVLGGDLGVINIQAKQLANRDHWLKDYIDSKVADLAGKTTPYYTVKVAAAPNYTLASQFTAPVAIYRLISMGEIFTGNNDLMQYYYNSVLHEMKIQVLNPTTLDFKLFRIDDNIYIYIDGVLRASSTVYSSRDRPKDLSFQVLPRVEPYTLQIVTNDAGGGINSVNLAARVIGTDVLFVS